MREDHRDDSTARSAELFGAESDIATSLQSDARRGYPSPGLES